MSSESTHIISLGNGLIGHESFKLLSHKVYDKNKGKIALGQQSRYSLRLTTQGLGELS